MNLTSSAECVEKVEEMLNRAIIQQEDLWRMLFLHSPPAPGHDDQQDAAAAPVLSSAIVREQRHGQVKHDDVIPPIVHRALTGKLHNSMDCCHLAVSRLNEILSRIQAPAPTCPPLVSGSPPARFLECETELPESQIVETLISKSKLHTLPLSPIQAAQVLPLKDKLEDLSSLPHPLASKGQQFSSCSFEAGRSSAVLSIAATASDSPSSSLNLAHTPKPSGVDPAAVSELGSMRLLDLMDSDPWPTELAWMSQLITLEDSVAADCSRQIATSVCQPDHAPAPYNVSAGTDAAAANTNLAAPCIKTDISEIVPKASIDSINDHHQITPSSRSPIRQKRHRDPAKAEAEKKSEIQYQRLQPGVKIKTRSIPCDGHQGWRKYGNKPIQNSSFCRAYYKCSVSSECNAKKMVQPMDKDPSIFEITYVGQHTCSSSSPNSNSRRRRKPRSSQQKNNKTSVLVTATTTETPTIPPVISTAITSDQLQVHQDAAKSPATYSPIEAVLSKKHLMLLSATENAVVSKPSLEKLQLQAPAVSQETAVAVAAGSALESSSLQEGCTSGSTDHSRSKSGSDADGESRPETDRKSEEGNGGNAVASVTDYHYLQNNQQSFFNFPAAAAPDFSSTLASSPLSWTHEYDDFLLQQLSSNDNVHPDQLRFANHVNLLQEEQQHQQLFTSSTTTQQQQQFNATVSTLLYGSFLEP
ncbi:unnamed protein product [Sphagnum compactum]